MGEIIMRKEALHNKLPVLKDYFSSNEAISTVYLFGSFGTSAYVPSHSDLDLAITFCREQSLIEEMKISADLTVILERENVDLVNLNKARVDLCHEILCSGEIIYEKDKIMTADFIEKTLQHYFDYGIPLKKIKADFFEALKEESGTHGR